jgi:hypothetical protein
MVQLQELLAACLALGVRVRPSTTDIVQSIMTSYLQATHERSAVHLDEPHVHHDDTAVSHSQQLDSMASNSDYVLSGLDTWLTAIHTRMWRLQRKLSRTNQSSVIRGQLHGSTTTSHDPAAAALSSLLLQLCGCHPVTTLVSGTLTMLPLKHPVLYLVNLCCAFSAVSSSDSMVCQLCWLWLYRSVWLKLYIICNCMQVAAR